MIKLDPTALEAAARMHDHWTRSPDTIGSMNAVRNSEEIIRAYLHTAAPSADGWRDIESAPTNGTPILALCLSPLDREPSLLAMEVIWFDGEWLFGDNTPLSELARKPSYWHPLPTAPAAKPEG